MINYLRTEMSTDSSEIYNVIPEEYNEMMDDSKVFFTRINSKKDISTLNLIKKRFFKENLIEILTKFIQVCGSFQRIFLRHPQLCDFNLVLRRKRSENC